MDLPDIKGIKTISTTIPIELWEQCKKEDLKMSHLIKVGFISLHKENEWRAKVQEQEEQIKGLIRARDTMERIIQKITAATGVNNPYNATGVSRDAAKLGGNRK